MRILFLSDTHLGIDMPLRPRVDRRRRGDDFFRNYELALAPALRGEVDVVLHGGDLHYRSRVPVSLADAALAPLRRVASAGVPVLLVLGNHERSRLPYPLLARHPNLHVFDRPRTVVLEARGVRVAFAGFPYVPQIRHRFDDTLAATGHEHAQAHHRILCLHQCVEGATCGAGATGTDYVFGDGDDVIRRAALPRNFALVMSGHIHRHQVLGRAAGAGPTVVYAGSVERTSFAEAGETKGVVRVDLNAASVTRLDFVPLQTRPMVVCRLSIAGLDRREARRRVAAALDATPSDAVVQLRAQGAFGPATDWMTAPALREMAGQRNVYVHQRDTYEATMRPR
jgi:DNA repair exonuclease SbcCD nuclease subunit